MESVDFSPLDNWKAVDTYRGWWTCHVWWEGIWSSGSYWSGTAFCGYGGNRKRWNGWTSRTGTLLEDRGLIECTLFNILSHYLLITIILFGYCWLLTHICLFTGIARNKRLHFNSFFLTFESLAFEWCVTSWSPGIGIRILNPRDPFCLDSLTEIFSASTLDSPFPANYYSTWPHDVEPSRIFLGRKRLKVFLVFLEQ